MPYFIKATVLVVCAFALRAQSVSLATNDTRIRLTAGSQAPLLAQLASNSGDQWQNRASESLLNQVEINGSNQPLHWQLNPGVTRIEPNHVQFVYDASTPRLRLFWDWRVRARSGPIEHSIRIQNLGNSEVWLPMQDSLRFDFSVAPEQALKYFWLEKAASSPSESGTHPIPLLAGTEWTGNSSTYAHPLKGMPREIIPYLLVERDNAEESGWYTGIEFSGRTRLTLRRNGLAIAGAVGLNPDPAPYRTRLPAGESFQTPVIFLGAFSGGPDAAGNILRRWIRTVLANPTTLHNALYPLLVSNSWGSGMAINEQQAHRMIQDASALGLEMFHLDAGWFRALGDWVSNPEKFPHGVASVADFAHQMGLKFGLWTDWTQAGVSPQPGALDVHDPAVRAWLTLDPPPDWKPEEFKGITIDIGVPAARAWAAAKVAQIVSDFHLDMLEHDGYVVAQGCDRKSHPHAPLDPATAKRYSDEGFLWVEGSNATDVSYHATNAYYQVQSLLRRRFPDLLLEICNDGGRMVDFGSAAHGDYFSISDAYDPLSNRRAFFDASYVLPPAMLETYVEKRPTPRLENFRAMLRSGMLGWFSLMLDSTTWNAEQHAAARAEFALYKRKLRPLIREADLYHASARPDGAHWDGMEYFDPAAGRGVLFAFRGALPKDDSHTFPLRGLRGSSIYRVTFQDHSSNDYSASGQQIMQAGVTVHATIPNSSELVFLDAVTH